MSGTATLPAVLMGRDGRCRECGGVVTFGIDHLCPGVFRRMRAAQRAYLDKALARGWPFKRPARVRVHRIGAVWVWECSRCYDAYAYGSGRWFRRAVVDADRHARGCHL